MTCHSIVSPIQFDVSPKPLFVRKQTYVEREEYDIHYDPNNDCITVVKTEILTTHQSTSSDSSKLSSAAPHGWQTVREVYIKEKEDPDLIHESTDEGVYEEVTHNSTSVNDDKECNEEEEEELKRSVRSLRSMEVSSLVSMISLTVVDYLSWTNFFKIIVVLFCINGLLLQIILLTIQYFSYETLVDLQMVSEEESEQNSVTLCLPLLYDEVLHTSDENNTIVRQRVSQLSDVFRISPKISCSLNELSVCRNPVQSVDNSYKCFTFSFNTGIRLSLNSSQSSDQYLYRISIHSTKTLPNGFENDFQTLSFDNAYELSFYSMRMKSLSSPYSRCKIYPRSSTRSECLHNCFINLIKTFCPNCVPKEVLIFEKDFNESMKFCPNLECNQDFQYFRNDCQQSCPQDCSQQFYYSSVLSTQESGSRVSLIIRKTNSFSTTGDFEFQHRPALTLELYFASLGGLSIIWLMIFVILFTIIYFSRKLIEFFSIQ